nr:hypothetical protein [Tanacetum cinerariifolium]
GEGGGGRGVRFDEEAIGPHGDGGFGDGFDEGGLAAGDAAALVGLLQRVRHVHHHGHAEGAHSGQVTEIDYQVAVAERVAAVGEDDVRV